MDILVVSLATVEGKHEYIGFTYLYTVEDKHKYVGL